MSAPEVSVVIPTRNRWKLLSCRALRSALSQERVEHEVIVVDDGSTDETPAQLVALDEPRLRIIRLEIRGGVARARNAGIAAASGEWIAFLDDDDVWSPNKLRAQLDQAVGERAELVYAGVVSVDEEGAVRYVFPLPSPAELPALILAASVLPAGCSNVLARTELVRAVGGFDERLFQLADWDLWIRLAGAGRAAACAEVLVAYLEHGENMLLADGGDVTFEFAYLERKHRASRDERGVELDHRTFFHWVAWGHLRRKQRLRAARVFLRSGIEGRRIGDILLAVAFVVRACVPLYSGRPILGRLLGPDRASSAVSPSGPSWLELYR